jgi:hypothetical protein
MIQTIHLTIDNGIALRFMALRRAEIRFQKNKAFEMTKLRCWLVDSQAIPFAGGDGSDGSVSPHGRHALGEGEGPMCIGDRCFFLLFLVCRAFCAPSPVGPV